MILVNGIPFGTELFPNGEVVFKHPVSHSGDFPMETAYDNKLSTIDMIFENNSDIANLMFAYEFLKKLTHCEHKICLNMMYLPYGRMDREINEQLFSLELFASIINKMGFHKVSACDIHSPVSEKLFNNFYPETAEKFIRQAIADFAPDCIMFPDKGARNKYTSDGYTVFQDFHQVYGEKLRDLNDKGKIIGYEIITKGVDISGKRILIVDDICAGGTTFISAAEELEKLRVGKIALYITHCENTIFRGGPKGKVLNNPLIERVYTTNSLIRKEDSDRITVLI